MITSHDSSFVVIFLSPAPLCSVRPALSCPYRLAGVQNQSPIFNCREMNWIGMFLQEGDQSVGKNPEIKTWDKIPNGIDSIFSEEVAE